MVINTDMAKTPAERKWAQRERDRARLGVKEYKGIGAAKLKKCLIPRKPAQPAEQPQSQPQPAQQPQAIEPSKTTNRNKKHLNNSKEYRTRL
jgi:hypothetical protein